MADYAVEVEVRSDSEAEREEMTNYDEVQDYLANGTYPEGATKAVKGVVSGKGQISSNSWMVSFTTRKTMMPFPQTDSPAPTLYQTYFSYEGD